MESQLVQDLGASYPIKAYAIKRQCTIEELLKELHLEEKFFVILVNGKRVGKDEFINENDEIMVLPKIAGGNE